ncbi:hypothetical protein [Pseudomonas iridis]|uniref:hypothetical protein n=1 Tax=Pseudomonas iridis TaxID=2710587 RepID=UPI001B3407AF|nr:hypothetical protein [Pseudomonas iridis]MBP5969929.1 hypothetical protein [Pseudomonas iridis]
MAQAFALGLFLGFSGVLVLNVLSGPHGFGLMEFPAAWLNHCWFAHIEKYPADNTRHGLKSWRRPEAIDWEWLVVHNLISHSCSN